MSDLREAIAQEVRVAYYRSLAAYELPCSDKQANVISKLAADAVLDVVTAHIAVTDEDAILVLRTYFDDTWDKPNFQSAEERAGDISDMKEALKSFVSSKLEPKPTDNGVIVDPEC